MKIINIVLGIATAIILGALINLGIAAFYPAPTYPSYPSVPIMAPCPPTDTLCVQESQQAEAQASQQAQVQFNQEQQAYEQVIGVYNRNVFIDANIIGIILFAIGFFLAFGSAVLAARGVPIGIMLAGLWGIVYGYAKGWGGVDNVLKFFVGVAVAVIVIGGSMWMMGRHAKRRNT